MKFLFVIFLFVSEICFADSLILSKSFLKNPNKDGFFSFSIRDGKKRVQVKLIKSGDSLRGRTDKGDTIVGIIKNNEIGIFFDNKYLESNFSLQKIYVAKKNDFICTQTSVNKHLVKSSLEKTRSLDFILGIDRDSYRKVSEVWLLALMEQVHRSYQKVGIKINFIGTTLFPERIKSGTFEEALEEYRKTSRSISRKNKADAMIVITSRRLNPDEVLGLAFLGSTCRYDGDFSIGITSFSGKSIQPTLVSHELGHTLNASHTNEGIMNGFIETAERNFSESSISEMSDYIKEYGGCLSHQAPVVRIEKRRKGFQEISISEISALCTLAFYDLLPGNKLDRIERRKPTFSKSVSKNSLLKLNNNAKFSLYCE